MKTTIANYPFKPVQVSDLVQEIKEQVGAADEEIKSFILSPDMATFDAASIYYFAVRHFGKR